MSQGSFDFDDFPDENADPRAANGNGEAEEEEDRRAALKEGLLRFSQRSQGGVAAPVDEGEEIESRNDFDELLVNEHGVILKRNPEDGKEYYYISRQHNHLALVHHLNAVLRNGKEDAFLDSFSSTITGRLDLVRYLAPMKSSAGEQDTPFRALLLSSATQTRAFEMIMQQMQKLAKEDDEEASQLGCVCVDHVRFLDSVFSPQDLFDSVFQRDIERWHATVRDKLIVAIPEIFSDPISQNDAASNLLALLTDVRVTESPGDFHMAVLSALRLLRSSDIETKRLRSTLLKGICEFEPRAVIEIVSLIFDGLDSSGPQHQTALHEILVMISTNLVLANMRVTRGNKNKKSADDVAIAVTNKISRFIQFSGSKGWKVVCSFLKSLSLDSSTEHAESEDGTAPKSLREWKEFDVLLAVSLLSVNSCPDTVPASIRAQLTEESRSPVEFLERFEKVFALPKFCSLHLPALLGLARSCLWSPSAVVRHFSAFLYETLLRTLDKKREEIFASMLEHLEQGEDEAATVLESLHAVMTKNYEAIQPYAGKIHESLSLLQSLSLPNVRRLLQIAIAICVKDPTQKELQCDLDDTSHRLIRSVSTKDRTLGVVALVMHLEATLVASSPERNETAKEILDRIQESTKGYASLRATLYNELRLMMERNHKLQKCESFFEWTGGLVEVFRSQFFKHRGPDVQPMSTLEGDKFARKECTLWLDVKHDRLIELVPLFSLLKELAVVRRRWSNDEETQEAREHSFEEFSFAFEANISLCGGGPVGGDGIEDKATLVVNATIYCHLIQWIRVLLNTFSAKDEPSTSTVSQLKSAKFTLLFELEKALKATVRPLNEFRVPPSIVKDLAVVLYDKTVKAKKTTVKRKKPIKKKGKGKKARNDSAGDAPEQEEELDKDEDVEEQNEQNEEAKNKEEEQTVKLNSAKRVPLSRLTTVFQPLKLPAIVQMLKLQCSRRRQSQYLLEALLRVVKVVYPKKEKKTVPWAVVHSPLDPPPASYHGDATSNWKCIVSATRPLVQLLGQTATYFKELGDTSLPDPTRPVSHTQTAAVLQDSLQILADLFAARELARPSEDEAGGHRHSEKRRILMETVERRVIAMTSSQREEEPPVEGAELTVLRFLLGIAEHVPTLECAVACLDACAAIEDRDEETEERLGRYSLQFMQREWSDDDGAPLKGAAFKQAVKRLFEHYLSFRILDDRPIAILWLLCEQLTALVGDGERRRSRMDSIASPSDEFVPAEMSGKVFGTLNKETFGPVYRVLFATLNSTIQSLLVGNGNAERIERTLALWSKTANAFCLLGLLLRVRLLRSITVLTAALKEGKQFLLLFSKSSSFLALLNDEAVFSTITNEVTLILKSVQMGNRALQNIANYAKSTKSQSLLRGIPELRAAGEGWMRAVHSALVFIGCGDAFQIQLLKSRNIDGEEIRPLEKDTIIDETTRDGTEEVKEEEEEVMEEGEEEQFDSDDEMGDAGRSRSPLF